MGRAVRPTWMFILLPVATLFLIPGVTIAGVCAGQSVAPPCCPSPCPIYDPTRLPALQTLAQDAVLTAGLEQQSNQTLSSIAAAVGSNLGGWQMSLAGNFLAGPVGISALPADSLVLVKQSLFEPLPPASSSALDLARRDQSRAMSAATEGVAGLSLSLQHAAGLPRTAAASQTQPPATDLQGALARLAGTRLILLADLMALDQLWTAGLSESVSKAARLYPVPAVSSATAPPNGTPIPANAMAAMTNSAPTRSAKPALQPQQNAAEAILARYPALQRTVTTASLAQRIQGNARATLADALTQAGLDPVSGLPLVQSSLLSRDQTGWQDAASKISAAEHAASQLLPQLVDQADSGSALRLQRSMAAWLDARKQAVYWRALSADAEAEISLLDQRLGEISDQVGFDITGQAARQAGISH